jgi:hypothetical protein
MALGHAQGVGWCGAAEHDRLVLGVSNAAFAWVAWRAGRLYALLQARGGGTGCSGGDGGGGSGGFISEAVAHDARVALRALDWGASGACLEAAVQEQVGGGAGSGLSFAPQAACLGRDGRLLVATGAHCTPTLPRWRRSRWSWC